MARVLLISPQLRVMKSTLTACSKNVHRRAVPLLGLGSLATVLALHAHTVRYLDTVIEGIGETHPFDSHTDFYGLNNDAVVREVQAFGPDLIGIGCLFTAQESLTTALAEAIRHKDAHVPIIVGGNHASLNWQDVLKCQAIDYVVKGEAEEACPRLIEALAEWQTARDLPDLAFRRSGTPVETPGIAHIARLDDLPSINYDLLPLNAYWTKGLPQNPFSKSRKALMYETSRGCPERCIFCSTAQFFGKKYRPKSARRVVSDIADLKRRYGVEEIQFSDDNIAVNRVRFLDICAGLAPLKLHLCMNNGIRLDHHDRKEADIHEIFSAMRDAGFYQITFAPESGNQWILDKVIQKHMDLKKVQRQARIAREEYGFHTHAFFILGLPYETREQMDDTIRYAESLGCNSYSVSVAVPFPPTELWQWCQRDGLLLKGVTDSDFLLGRSIIRRTDDLTPGQIEDMAERVAARLNGRPADA